LVLHSEHYDEKTYVRCSHETEMSTHNVNRIWSKVAFDDAAYMALKRNWMALGELR
jgi:hypothetical protein